MSVNPPLKMSAVSLRYGSRTLFKDFDLTIERGQTVALMGPSGSGKTSLVSAILGQTPYEGAIVVDGVTVGKRTARRVRRELVGVVFQHGELLTELSPIENIALGALVCGTARGVAMAEARELMNRLRIPHADSCDTLSGGERQRTALARALIKKPSLVLADEPTGSLDEEMRDQAAELLFTAAAEQHSALLVVTHDPSVAALADRRIQMAALAGPSKSSGEPIEASV